MTGLRLPFVALLGALAAAAPVHAQGRDCTIAHIAEGGFARQLAGPGGAQMRFLSGPVELHCQGGIIVRADSAHSTGRGELRLIRDVFYQDSTQILTSITATYFRDEGRLLARGDVEVRDRHGPSTVRGSEMQYDRIMPGRDEVRMIMRGRSRAYIYEEGTPPLPEGMEPSPSLRLHEGDTIPAALQVDADELEMLGENRVIATGRVQMIRENIRAWGEAATYDQAIGRMELTGSARIEGEGYELLGDRIVATLPGDELERVIAEGNGRLFGAELQVRAPVIDIALSEGTVERMVAVNRGASASRAVAEARDFTMIADSIQADAPGEVVERIVAVGDAYGERAVDSASVDLPELIQADWLRGDTVVGTFVQLEADEATGDSARTALETLTAVGGLTPARSLYRMQASDEESDRPAVNYLVASRIAIAFDDGEVANVEADGPVEGVHLEPERQRAAAPPEPVDVQEVTP